MKPPKHLQAPNGIHAPTAADIKSQVQSLSTNDLQDISAYVAGLLVSRITADQERLEMTIYGYLSEWFQAVQGRPLAPYVTFRQHADYARFRKACEALDAFIVKYMTEPQGREMYRLCVSLFMSIAGDRSNQIFTLVNRKLMIRMLAEPEALFDSAFPGYIRNNQVRLAFDSWLAGQVIKRE